MTDDFEYDVAFSFTQQDETLAQQINDLLADRMKTFIYSDRQKELAGTDGQETFSEVYGKSARIVVIFYRKEWGNTRWTGIEMNAIKNRSLNHGWNFTVFVPTEAKPTMPPWVPETRLYVGLERWGINGAAASIEQRVKESGGQPHQETVIERAARHARARDLAAKQKQFLESDYGVNQARQAYEDLSTELENQVTAIRAATGVHMSARRSDTLRLINSDPVNLIISWYAHYTNSLDGVYLKVDFYKGFPRLPGFMPSMFEARQLRSMQFSYQLIREGHAAYVQKGQPDRDYTPQQLSDHLLTMLMDLAEKNRRD